MILSLNFHNWELTSPTDKQRWGVLTNYISQNYIIYLQNKCNQLQLLRKCAIKFQLLLKVLMITKGNYILIFSVKNLGYMMHNIHFVAFDVFDVCNAMFCHFQSM